MNSFVQLSAVSMSFFLCLSSGYAKDAKDGKCLYQINKDNIQISYTAFKTSEKVPAKGTFSKYEYKGPVTSQDLNGLLKNAKIEIDATALETGDPARNTNIIEGFFKKLKNGPKLEASFPPGAKVKNGNQVDLRIQFNGKQKTIPMNFKIEDKKIVLTGKLDILDFNGSAALESLNQLCHELHKGKDGVSKTWSEVELMVNVGLEQACS